MEPPIIFSLSSLADGWNAKTITTTSFFSVIISTHCEVYKPDFQLRRSDIRLAAPWVSIEQKNNAPNRDFIGNFLALLYLFLCFHSRRHGEGSPRFVSGSMEVRGLHFDPYHRIRVL